MARSTSQQQQSNGQRAAIYARVSDKSQETEDKTSISEQISDMETHCQRRGLTITARYQEVGRGWSKNRPVFQKMLADARKGRLARRTPKDTDGRREDSGRGMRELQGRWPGLHWGRWEVGGTVFSRRTGFLWPSAGAAMRGMAREYAAGNARGPGWREFAGTLGQLQAGRQAGSGMARSRAKARVNWDSQGQRRGEMQSEAARRAGDPSHQSEDPPPEGLGGYGPFAQTNPRRPAGEVMRHHLDRQPGAVGGETPRRHVVQPDAVLEVAYGVVDLGVAAMIGLQRLTIAVGDEAVIAVSGEESQLGTGSGPDPADDEPHRLGVGLGLEGRVSGLGHVGGSIHPVGYGLYEIAQALVLADGDGEADTVVATDGDDVVCVEATVGPHGELTGGPGVAYPSHGLTQEVGGAAGRVGPTPAQPTHQHVAGAGGDGQQRVIAPLAGVAMMARPLLAQPVGLADGGIEINGQRTVAGAGPGVPGPDQQFPAHPVQLAHMAPPKAAQEGPQGGWRLDDAAQHSPGPSGTQLVSVVDAVAPGKGRRHQGQYLVSRIRPTWRIPNVNVAVHQVAQTQAPGHGDRQEQPGIGHQTVVVERYVDAVGTLRW